VASVHVVPTTRLHGSSQCLVGLKPDLPQMLEVGLVLNSSVDWQCMYALDS